MKVAPELLNKAFTESVESKGLTGDIPAQEQFVTVAEQITDKLLDVGQGLAI